MCWRCAGDVADRDDADLCSGPLVYRSSIYSVQDTEYRPGSKVSASPPVAARSGQPEGDSLSFVRFTSYAQAKQRQVVCDKVLSLVGPSNRGRGSWLAAIDSHRQPLRDARVLRLRQTQRPPAAPASETRDRPRPCAAGLEFLLRRWGLAGPGSTVASTTRPDRYTVTVTVHSRQTDRQTDRRRPADSIKKDKDVFVVTAAFAFAVAVAAVAAACSLLRTACLTITTTSTPLYRYCIDLRYIACLV
ncbi:hypothetical protein A7C99_1707 [Trichophyton rubrum]|uniref:Uncharacterized protein n=1 Tax=Trichophyton rubrum TaxID=5551 RepID=A0A178F1L5_TRIRU|nr:hypothetical protein A7C99_1707 [Trichophyton rubrum]